MKYKRKKMNEKHVNKLNHLQILLKWKLEDEEKKKRNRDSSFKPIRNE